MIVDTGKQGWHILYSACDDDRLDSNHTEGQSFWETFAVPDVVRLELHTFIPTCTSHHTQAMSCSVMHKLSDQAQLGECPFKPR